MHDSHAEPGKAQADGHTSAGQGGSGGWRAVLLGVKQRIVDDRLSLVAAGVGFYAFLSIFPAITALLAIYGMVADPADVAQQIGALRGTVPASTLQLVQQQMTSVAQGSGSSLGIGLVVSILIAIYSASKGMSALISSLNIVFDERETRGFVKLKGVALLFTFGAVCLVLLMLVMIALPGYLQHAGLPDWLTLAIRVVRWLIMLALMAVAVAVVYGFAPSREEPRMRWISPGAFVAVILWLVASIAFSIYLSNFGSYNKTYGSVAAIAILLLWFWISAFAILIGAEFNAQLQQRRRAETEGARDSGARW